MPFAMWDNIKEEVEVMREADILNNPNQHIVCQSPLECLKLTAFGTLDGSYVYQFKRMLFRMINSAATFNHMMRKMFHQVKNIKHYDVLVYKPD